MTDRTAPDRALRASLFEAVADALPSPIGIWSLAPGKWDTGSLTLVAMNRAAAAQAGPGQGVGRTMAEMGRVVAGTESAHAILATLTDGRTRHLDAAPWLGPAGEKSWFRRTIVAVGGAAAVVATDVTALREADENLALYSKLVEAAPIGLSVWRLEAPDDPGSFVLEVVNAEAAKMAGVPAGELVGRRMDALTPETVRGGRAAEYVAVTLGELAPFTRRSLVVTPSNRQTEIVVSAFPVPGQRLGLSTLALPS